MSTRAAILYSTPDATMYHQIMLINPWATCQHVRYIIFNSWCYRVSTDNARRRPLMVQSDWLEEYSTFLYMTISHFYLILKMFDELLLFMTGCNLQIGLIIVFSSSPIIWFMLTVAQYFHLSNHLNFTRDYHLCIFRSF